jgi:hypothetical protein
LAVSQAREAHKEKSPQRELMRVVVCLSLMAVQASLTSCAEKLTQSSIFSAIPKLFENVDERERVNSYFLLA